MIVIRIEGGLGNQMFQYACVRAASIRNKIDFGLDVNTWFNNIGNATPRSYELPLFPDLKNVIYPPEINKIFQTELISSVYS